MWEVLPLVGGMVIGGAGGAMAPSRRAFLSLAAAGVLAIALFAALGSGELAESPLYLLVDGGIAIAGVAVGLSVQRLVAAQRRSTS